MAMTDYVASLSTPWLSDGDTAKFLSLLGSASDTLLDKLEQAMYARMPGLAKTDTAIPYQAEDRLLAQGPSETNSQFILRLQRAFETWQHAGSRAAILEQLKAYRTALDPGVVVTDPSMLIVGGGANYTSWDVSEFGEDPKTAPARRRVAPPNWDWDGVVKPWRSWLVLFMRSVAAGISGSAASVTTVGGSGVSGVTSGFATLTGLTGMSSALIGSWIRISGAASSGNNGFFQIVLCPSSSSAMIANTNPGVAPDANNGAIVWSVESYPFFRPTQPYGAPTFVWGSGFWGVEWAGHDTVATIASIRAILQRWKSARTYYPYILVSFNGRDGTAGSQFSPLSGGADNPHANFGDYGSNSSGVWIPRAPGYPLTAFLDGTGKYVQCNVQNVT